MARTGDDSWDLASSVGATATMVAAARAMASATDDPLIDDPWAAPLVRASEWAKLFGVDLWDEQEANRFRRLVKVVAPLCCADGRLAFSDGQISKPIAMLVSAMRLAGWKKKSAPLSAFCSMRTDSGIGLPSRPGMQMLPILTISLLNSVRIAALPSATGGPGQGLRS